MTFDSKIDFVCKLDQNFLHFVFEQRKLSEATNFRSSSLTRFKVTEGHLYKQHRPK